MKIITDNKWKLFIYGSDLTEKERKDFDWEKDIDSTNFIRYRNRVYSVNEFMRFDYNKGKVPTEFSGWDGYLGDSYFSGIVIKMSDNGEAYKIGTYIS